MPQLMKADPMNLLLTVLVLVGTSFPQISGHLNYKFHGEFENVWNDRGSGATLEGSFWKPKNVPEGYYILGHLATDNHNFDRSSFAVLVKSESANDLKPPQSLLWIYDDYKTGAAEDVTIVQPIPPEGYVCLGMVAYPKRAMPTLQDFPLLRCVRNDFVAQGNTGKLYWSDEKSGGEHDFSTWQIVSADPNIGLAVGAFYGHRSHNRPAGDLYVLKKQSLGAETDFQTQVTDLMRVHSPDVYFHPAEKYFPDNAETIFNQLTFFYGKVVNNYDNFKRDVKASFPNFGTLGNQEALMNQAKAGRYKYWLGVPDHLFPGNLSRSRVYMGAVDRPEVVCVQSLTPPLAILPEQMSRENSTISCSQRDDAFVDLVFFIFYPFNGPGQYKAMLGNLPLQGARLKLSGNHQGDWEYFTIRVRKPVYAHDPVLIEDYYVSVHNGGGWVGTKLESNSDGKPILYSALYTHAMYASAGNQEYCRPKSVNLGIGTFTVALIDTTARGQVLKTWENVQFIEPNIYNVTQPGAGWFNFTGSWGDYYKVSETITTLASIPAYTFTEVSSGPSGPKVKGVWKAKEITEPVQC